MAITTEINRLYPFSNEFCFYKLKELVLPNITVKYQVGYFNLKIPIGKVICEDISDRDDFRVCKAIVQFKCIPLIGFSFNLGSPVKVLCRATGDNYCSVDIVTDATKFYSSNFLNTVADILYKKIPVYSWLVRKIVPNIYFDDVKVIDGEKFKSKSLGKDLAKPGIDYLFQKIHKILSEELKV
jgi:hypothetical protein